MTESTTTETTASPQLSGEGNALAPAANETTTPAPEGEGEQSPHRVPPSVQRRIDAAIRQRGEAEREATAAKLELDALKRQLNAGKTPEDGQAAPEQRANESSADFEKRVDARAQQILAAREYEGKMKSFSAAGEKEYSDFNDRCNAVATFLDRDKIPHFMSIVTDIDDGHIAIAKLADDPDAAERVLKMAPHKMAIELAKLASEKPKAAKKPVSSAPEPIKPASGNARADGYRPNMTVEEHVEWVRKNDPARQGVYAKR